MKNYLIVCLIVVLALGVTAASAQKTPSSGPALRAAPGSSDAGTTQDGTPDAMISLDISGDIKPM